MSNDKKISEFLSDSTIADTTEFTFVSNNVNYKTTFADLKANLGTVGALTSIGDVTGVPILNQPSATSNEMRKVIGAKGVVASLSAGDGVQVAGNFANGSAGAQIIQSLTSDITTFRSLEAGLGLSIIEDGTKITLTNTVDPATGLSGRVVVTQASDLAGALDSTKEYFIDGIIDMGAQQITVPTGGLSLAGYNFDLSKLTTSEAGYTMFTSAAGGSGDFLGRDFAVEVTGAGSQVYDVVDVDGTNAIETARVNYNNCTSLGTIDGYRQGLESGTGRFGGTPTLTLKNPWAGGYFIEASIVRGLTDGSYALYSAGTGFTMTSRFRTNQNVDLPASASFIDFAPANFTNPSTLQLDGCILSRDGVFNASDTNIAPNTSENELTSAWADNIGLHNTFVGGETHITAEITTTITIDGTYVDLAGTYTPQSLVHFDSPSNGQLRLIGTIPTAYRVEAELVLESTSGDTVSAKVVIYRAATASFEDSQSLSRVVNNLQGSRNVAYMTLIANVVLNQNDYVKIQVANIGATNNITAELDSYFIVEAR